MKKTVCVLAVCSAMATAQVATAALLVTNGDFETGGGENVADVTDWFDNNPGGFWEGAWQTNAPWITPNGTNLVVFSSIESEVFGMPTSDVNDGSYLYQSIGAADGAASLEIEFDWGAPDDAGPDLELGMTVGVYAYDGAGGFTPADGTDARGESGVALLDSESFTMTTTGVDGQMVSEVAAIDLSGAGSQELFLRFNGFTAGATGAWPVLDNVRIVPEPASMVLLCLGSLAFVARRR